MCSNIFLEYDNVIDEEALSPRLTVTFDGENATVYKYGEKVKKPADPVKEDTEDYAYIHLTYLLESM